MNVIMLEDNNDNVNIYCRRGIARFPRSMKLEVERWLVANSRKITTHAPWFKVYRVRMKDFERWYEGIENAYRADKGVRA